VTGHLGVSKFENSWSITDKGSTKVDLTPCLIGPQDKGVEVVGQRGHRCSR